MEGSDANATLANLLVMTLLPLARYRDGEHSPEQLRVTCLEACDALSKHASYLRQVIGVSQPQFDSVYLVIGNSVGVAPVNGGTRDNSRAIELPKASPARVPAPPAELLEETEEYDFRDEDDILDRIYRS